MLVEYNNEKEWENAILNLSNNDVSKNKFINNDRYAYLLSRFEYFSNELKNKHMTLQKLWEEYIEENPDGYSRSQFIEHFSRWRKSCELTMHI